MEKIHLPTREISDRMSLNKTLLKRVSCRNFDKKPVYKSHLSNILWAGQGLLSKKHDMRRTTPSAGSTFPLELLVAVRKDGVLELDAGIYHYLPEENALEVISNKEITDDVSAACFNQEFIRNAGFSILVASDLERTTQMYAERGERYVYIEAGAAMQNISLEAVEQGLGTVIIGAFDDSAINELFGLEKLMPLSIMPVGLPKDKALYA
jgi:SagB-type dehydrogenase family enzyme